MNTKSIIDYGIYIAILLIMGLTPQIGFIKVGTIAISTMMLPIIVLIIHKKYLGIIVGFSMWGLTSFLSMFYTGSPFLLLGIGPAALNLICGRLLIIFPTSLVFYIFQKMKLNKYLKSYFLSLIIAISNTLFIFGFLLILQLFNVYLFANKNFTMLVLFSANSLNIILEWTIFPFIGATISFVGFYLQEKEENLKKISF